MKSSPLHTATVPSEDRSERISIGGCKVRVTPTIHGAYHCFLRDEHTTSGTDALNRLYYDALSMRGYLPQIKTRPVTLRDLPPLIEMRIERCLQQNPGMSREDAIDYFLNLGSERAELHEYQDALEGIEAERMAG